MTARWPLLVVTRGAESRSTPFLLIERANHDLKLRIGENTAQSENSRSDERCAQASRTSSASIAFALMARLPLRLPPVTGNCPTGTVARIDKRDNRPGFTGRRCSRRAAAAKDSLDSEC